MSGKYLVTGTAGTGKTTLERALKQRGYATKDIDQGFARWYDRQTMETCKYRPDGGQEWLNAHTYRLNLPLIKAFLANDYDQPLFMLGHTGDIFEQRVLFDRVFLLEYPNDEIVRHRLSTRTENPYVKHPDELAKELSYYKTFQDEFRVAGAISIDCTLPPANIIAIIEQSISD